MSAKKPPERRQNKATAVQPTPVAPAKFEAPPVPDHLGRVGAETWAALWELGGPSGVYSPKADVYVIDRYASLVERRAELVDVLSGEGYTTYGSMGQLAVHPAAKVLREVEADMFKLEEKLGLNPTARFSLEGLALGVEETKSKLESFLSGG